MDHREHHAVPDMQQSHQNHRVPPLPTAQMLQCGARYDPQYEYESSKSAVIWLAGALVYAVSNSFLLQYLKPHIGNAVMLVSMLYALIFFLPMSKFRPKYQHSYRLISEAERISSKTDLWAGLAALLATIMISVIVFILSRR